MFKHRVSGDFCTALYLVHATCTELWVTFAIQQMMPEFDSRSGYRLLLSIFLVVAFFFIPEENIWKADLSLVGHNTFLQM